MIMPGPRHLPTAGIGGCALPIAMASLDSITAVDLVEDPCNVASYGQNRIVSDQIAEEQITILLGAGYQPIWRARKITALPERGCLSLHGANLIRH